MCLGWIAPLQTFKLLTGGNAQVKFLGRWKETGKKEFVSVINIILRKQIYKNHKMLSLC